MLVGRGGTVLKSERYYRTREGIFSTVTRKKAGRQRNIFDILAGASDFFSSPKRSDLFWDLLNHLFKCGKRKWVHKAD